MELFMERPYRVLFLEISGSPGVAMYQYLSHNLKVSKGLGGTVKDLRVTTWLPNSL